MITALALPTSALYAQSFDCQISSYYKSSGFGSQEAGNAWVPDRLNLRIEDGSVVFGYFDATVIDNSPKIEGNVITARDEFSSKTDDGVSWLIKSKLTFDKASGEAKFLATNTASGYENAQFGGRYNCK